MSEIILYQTEDGQTRIEVHMENETVWLSQAQMVELFQTTKQNVSLHLNNAFKEGELDAHAVVKDYLTTATDGKSYKVKHYNLDAIISVGYRVKSIHGTQFRRWALGVLREYLIKGFAMNDDALKKVGGGNYWEELLTRIRDIRSSEKMIYRQVLDLYATSVDYNPKAPETRAFFKAVQNKIHYAAHGHTAAEVIVQRADAAQPNMGLTSYAGEMPVRGDIGIAKNYLTHDELEMLNRMVTTFFELAELRALQRQPMYMKDWVQELDDFATRYGKGILPGLGKVSHETAMEKATEEFEKYRKRMTEALSPVEREYLTSIAEAQKKLKGTTSAETDKQNPIRESGLADAIGGMAQIIDNNAVALQPDVERIISERSTDENKITHLLDTLIDMAGMSKLADELFMRLNGYYAGINPAGAAENIKRYDNQYGDHADSDGDDDE